MIKLPCRYSVLSSSESRYALVLGLLGSRQRTLGGDTLLCINSASRSTPHESWCSLWLRLVSLTPNAAKSELLLLTRRCLRPVRLSVLPFHLLSPLQTVTVPETLDFFRLGLIL